SPLVEAPGHDNDTFRRGDRTRSAARRNRSTGTRRHQCAERVLAFAVVLASEVGSGVILADGDDRTADFASAGDPLEHGPATARPDCFAHHREIGEETIEHFE